MAKRVIKVPPLNVTNGYEQKIIDMDDEIYKLLYKIMHRKTERGGRRNHLDFPVISDDANGTIGVLTMFNNYSVMLFITDNKDEKAIDDENYLKKLAEKEGKPLPVSNKSSSNTLNFYTDIKNYKLISMRDMSDTNKLIFKLIKFEKDKKVI